MVAAAALLSAVALLHAFPRSTHVGQAPLRHGAARPHPSVVASGASGEPRPAEEEADLLIREHKAAKARAEAMEAEIAEHALRAEEGELVDDDPVEPEAVPSTHYHHADEPDVTTNPSRSADGEGAHERRAGDTESKDSYLPHPQPHPQPHIRRSNVQMVSEKEGATSPIDVVAPDPAGGACNVGDAKATGATLTHDWFRRLKRHFLSLVGAPNE